MSEIYSIIEKKKLDVVSNPIEKSHDLPNECYTSEKYTHLERKKLFEDKWVVIGVAFFVVISPLAGAALSKLTVPDRDF